jgi:hypothetical protein
VSHLAGLDQRAQGFELLVQRGFGLVLGRVEIDDAEGRHVALGPMDLVQIDHIGLQPAQAGVARGHDVGRRHPTAGADPGHAARRARDLGGQHHLLAHAWVSSQTSCR